MWTEKKDRKNHFTLTTTYFNYHVTCDFFVFFSHFFPKPCFYFYLTWMGRVGRVIFFGQRSSFFLVFWLSARASGIVTVLYESVPSGVWWQSCVTLTFNWWHVGCCYWRMFINYRNCRLLYVCMVTVVGTKLEIYRINGIEIKTEYYCES